MNIVKVSAKFLVFSLALIYFGMRANSGPKNEWLLPHINSDDDLSAISGYDLSTMVVGSSNSHQSFNQSIQMIENDTSSNNWRDIKLGEISDGIVDCIKSDCCINTGKLAASLALKGLAYYSLGLVVPENYSILLGREMTEDDFVRSAPDGNVGSIDDALGSPFLLLFGIIFCLGDRACSCVENVGLPVLVPCCLAAGSFCVDCELCGCCSDTKED